MTKTIIKNKANFADFILKHRLFFIISSLIFIISLALLVTALDKLPVSKTDYRVYFSKENPQLKVMDELNETYTATDSILLVISAKEGDIFTPESTTAISRLTEQAWDLPYVAQVSSITNYKHAQLINGRIQHTNLFPAPISLNKLQLNTIREQALSDPVLLNNLISEDGRVSAINIVLNFPGLNDNTELPETVESIRQLLSNAEEHYPHLEFRTTGLLMLNNAFNENMQHDMQSIYPLSFIIITLLITLFTRDFSKINRSFTKHLLHQLAFTFIIMIGASIVLNIVVGSTLHDSQGLFGLPGGLLNSLLLLAAAFILLLQICLHFFPATTAICLLVAISIACSYLFSGLMGFPISPPSSAAPVIILTVAIANSIHIVITTRHEINLGQDKDESITESLKINTRPIILASLTTAIGFLTLNFSEVPPFQHLGNIVAVGVLTSCLLSLTFLPAMLSILPNTISKKVSSTPWTKNLSSFVIEKSQILLFAGTTIVLITISFIPRNELNDVFVNYFDKDIAFRSDTDYTTENLTGIYQIDYSLDSHKDNGLTDIDFLKQVDSYAQWFRQQPETSYVHSITDQLKVYEKIFNKIDNLPNSDAVAERYLNLYKTNLDNALLYRSQINETRSATRMSVRLYTLSTNEMLALLERAEHWRLINTPLLTNTEGTGPAVMFAYIGHRNIRSMLLGSLVALLLISGILIFALRSVKLGLLSILPNIIPMALGFGLWGLFVGEVGLSLSIVTSMTLGIVVDDTVHFLSKYQRARQYEKLSTRDAIHYAFNKVGPALLITSLILVIGFSVLMLSSFALNSSMGALTILIIALALLADFLLLPALLLKLDKNNSVNMY